MIDIKQKEKIIRLYERGRQNIKSGEIRKAETVINELKKFSPSPFVSLVSSGLMIDVGDIKPNKVLVEEGVKILKGDIREIVDKFKTYAPSALYNLANGYSALFSFKRANNINYSLFRKTEIEKAKIYYLKALEKKIENPILISQIWVNLGNCYDHVGRVFDALDCYERALYYNPEHGMALGNKGMALYYYAAISSKYQQSILKESYLLIQKALKFGVNIEARKMFNEYLERIEKLFPDGDYLQKQSEYSGINIKSRTKFESFLVEFCMKNKLYLNICNFCQKCNNAIGDPESIEQMLVTWGENEKRDFTRRDQYLHLSSYLNQIKQDYITARFTLILSRYKGRNLDFVDKRVRLIDTLDYGCHNIYIELVKASFNYFCNILDKIASFIEDYLKIQHPERKFLNFNNIWFDPNDRKKIRKEILNTNNFSLNALYNIYLDLYKGPQKELRIIRNKLTHSFLKIYHPFGMFDEKSMTEEILVENTMEMAKLVRNAILYLLKFVFLQESKKKVGLNRDVISETAFEIPDNFKSFR